MEGTRLSRAASASCDPTISKHRPSKHISCTTTICILHTRRPSAGFLTFDYAEALTRVLGIEDLIVDYGYRKAGSSPVFPMSNQFKSDPMAQMMMPKLGRRGRTIPLMSTSVNSLLSLASIMTNFHTCASALTPNAGKKNFTKGQSCTGMPCKDLMQDHQRPTIVAMTNGSLRTTNKNKLRRTFQSIERAMKGCRTQTSTTYIAEPKRTSTT